MTEKYSKDKHRVFYKWVSPGRFWVVEIPKADAKTFKAMSNDLAKDKNHVWISDFVVKGADPATAEVVNPGFVWKDARRVYYQYDVIKGADPKTFRQLTKTFYRDATRLYWCDVPVRAEKLSGGEAKFTRPDGETVRLTLSDLDKKDRDFVFDMFRST